jgi:uncharacterized membrane protein
MYFAAMLRRRYSTMHTPASIAKHPIHPMLVTIPIGLWLFSFVCDLIYVFTDASDAWAVVGFYTMLGGIIGALAAAVPGMIDMLSLPSGVKKIAIIHMSINLTIVVLYIVNAWLRIGEVETLWPLWLSIAAIVLLAVSGWLGGKMVYVHGVGVQVPPQPVP